MTQKPEIKLFDEKLVRTLWDDEQEKWFFFCCGCGGHSNR